MPKETNFVTSECVGKSFSSANGAFMSFNQRHPYIRKNLELFTEAYQSDKDRKVWGKIGPHLNTASVKALCKIADSARIDLADCNGTMRVMPNTFSSILINPVSFFRCCALVCT